MNVSNMSSSDILDILMEYDKKKAKLKITTIDGSVFNCKLHCPAEDEEDWAYDIITLDNPSRFYTLECNFIETIEKIADSEENMINESVAKTA